MNRKHLSSLICGIATVALVGCGGTVANKKDMTDLAADAPPPPSGGGSTQSGPKRKVSVEAKGDFAQTAAAHKKAAQGGWTKAECNSMASRWSSLHDDHKKLIEARYNAGVSYQNCKMMKDAEKQYHKALKQNPNHGPSLSNLGSIYFVGGNRKRAKQYWDKAVQADTTLSVTGARANKAWLLIEQIRGGGSRALEKTASGSLSRALAIEFENKEAYVMYALLYLEGSEKNKSRLALADLLLNKASEIDDRYAPLHNARGLFLLKRENVAQALESFRLAVKYNPKFAQAWLNVGNIVLDFRKYGEAKAAFQAVLKLQSKNYDAIVGLGIAQRGLKDYNGAEASYKKAWAMNKKRPDAAFNLGVLYQDFRANETENLKKAQSAYRTAVKHFNSARNAAGASPSVKKEAADNIKTCNKNIKTISDTIAFQAKNK